MTKQQTETTTPPEESGFKELEFREWEESFMWVATGPFGVKFKVINWDGYYEVNADGCGAIRKGLPTYEAAAQAANEHCHKELGRWVR